MNLRDKAIFDWVNENVPGLRPIILKGMETEAIQAVMTIAFEAGREFQNTNPTAELKNPDIYIVK